MREYAQHSPKSFAFTDTGALIPEEGACQVNGESCTRDMPSALPAQTITPGDCKSWLRFCLSQTPPATGGTILKCERVDLVSSSVLMRLDQVTFPTGAIAYRHIHPGPGIRYLDLGHLHLQADDHAFESDVGDSWFEAANSPVRATASSELEQSRFIRFMVLPLEFAGKPSIQILDPEDAARSRLQVTKRYFEQIVHVDAG